VLESQPAAPGTVLKPRPKESGCARAWHTRGSERTPVCAEERAPRGGRAQQIVQDVVEQCHRPLLAPAQPAASDRALAPAASAPQHCTHLHRRGALAGGLVLVVAAAALARFNRLRAKPLLHALLVEATLAGAAVRRGGELDEVGGHVAVVDRHHSPCFEQLPVSEADARSFGRAAQALGGPPFELWSRCESLYLPACASQLAERRAGGAWQRWGREADLSRARAMNP
jgi:hypothetical protein